MPDTSAVLDFEQGRCKYGNRLRQQREQLAPIRTTLVRLGEQIDAAQQAHKAAEMLRNGYCGSGLKDVISEAAALSMYLTEAGRSIQELIAILETKGL